MYPRVNLLQGLRWCDAPQISCRLASQAEELEIVTATVSWYPLAQAVHSSQLETAA